MLVAISISLTLGSDDRMIKFVSVLDDPKLVYEVEGRLDAQLLQSHVS